MRNSECRLLIPHSAFRTPHSEQGIALLIVVSLLTVIGIMGVAFAFSMYLETQATRQFVATTQARYVAEAGIAYARALLDEDRLGSRVDELSEPWAAAPAGGDADVDGDGTREAAWWPVQDGAGAVVGRHALMILDESGKVNVNAAQAEPSPTALGALNLTLLLQQAGIANAAGAARAIEAYRDGPDARPGQAGIDDDRDGSIDDLDEYQPLAPAGDDRRVESLDELTAIAGLTAEEVRRLSRMATTYSWDMNVSVTGKTRVNVNTITAAELLPALLDAGVGDPWQAAVNIADYVDRDLELSRVTRASQMVSITNQGPLGVWGWRDEPSGHYATELAGGAPLAWSVAVPTGTFRLLARGLDGGKIGDLTVGGQHVPSVDDGQSLGEFQLSGTLEVSVTNGEPAGTPCAFRGLELVSESQEGGTVVRGIEAVRVNEVMVDPDVTLEAASAAFEVQGSDWACPTGAGVCSNSGVGEARWTWTDAALPAGRYYVQVFGSAAGQTVGQVRVDSSTQLLAHGQIHPQPAAVGSDGKVVLAIGKTASEGTYYLKSVTLSLQPDGEYVELINLSDDDLDVGGWTIEGELAGGRQGRFPAGSVIAAHGLLVAVVDLDDTQSGLNGNGIDARSAWGMSADAPAAQLEFPSGAPTPEDDWLKTTLPAGTPARLMVRTGAVTVDEVSYTLPPPTAGTLQSLEKGDPTVTMDQNGDGVDDGWYTSLRLYTPGEVNDNNGMQELVGLETVTHDPAGEVTILNRPLDGVGELAGLPSGVAWRPFASEDLAKVVDRFTVEGFRLEAEGHWAGGGEGAWEEQGDGSFAHTDPAQADVEGRWRWSGLSDGTYRLSVYSCDGCAGEQLAVRWEQAAGTPAEWSPALSTDIQGRLVIGQVTIGGDGTPEGALTLDARCDSPSGICHVDYVRLDPQILRVGPLNVNTAPTEALLVLPGMSDALASAIIAGRPYGDQDEKGRGIGDLLMGDILGDDEEETLEVFRRIAHLLTTRSDLFQIISLGQALNGDRVEAAQRIQTVVQR